MGEGPSVAFLDLAWSTVSILDADKSMIKYIYICNREQEWSKKSISNITKQKAMSHRNTTASVTAL